METVLTSSSYQLRVLFIGADADAEGPQGGQATVSGLIADRARHLGHDVVALHSKAADERRSAVRIGAALTRIRAAVIELRRGPDVVLIFAGALPSFLERSVVVAAACAFRVPVAIAPRSGHLRDAIVRSRVIRMLVRTVLQWCDLILCQGATWFQFYGELSPKVATRCVVAPNPVDPRALMAGRSRAIVHRQGVLPFTFLFVGQLASQKGVHELIQAFAGLRASTGPYRMLVCGSGPAAADLERSIRKLGIDRASVDFRGWCSRTAVREAMHSADAVVLPSHTEGLPNVILEAMACGLPVIATPVGAVADVVEDGRNGFLVPPNDVALLRLAMERLAGDPAAARSMGSRGRELAEKFSVERTIDPMLDLLAILVAASREKRAGRSS